MILNVLTLHKIACLTYKCADYFSTVQSDLQLLNVHIHLVLQILPCIVLLVVLVIDK